jgi:flagellar FliL protein
MAEETNQELPKEKPVKKGFNFKVIIIGLPLFIVQLVLVYFITATFLVKTVPNSVGSSGTEQLDENGELVVDEDEEPAAAQKIFNIEDLIINPAGTSGQRLLLLSVGFGVPDEEKLTHLMENEVIIKDMVINTVSQKTLGALSNIQLKDSLKVELASKINSAYPKAEVKNVYFSKYLIN